MKYIFILIIISNYGYAFKSEEGCTLTPKSGENSNRANLLNKLQIKGLYGLKYSYENKSIEYTLKICGDANKEPNATLIKNIADTTVVTIGLRNMTDVIGTDYWILLSFKAPTVPDITFPCPDSNSTITSDVMILCDPNEHQGKFKLLAQDKDTCRYSFQLRTSLLCSTQSRMSGWSIFFLILFFGFLAYFISGVTYLRCVVGAKGIEQIPHKAFWFRIGNMFADGCNAVCRCDRYCDGIDETGSLTSPYSDYSPIGGTTSPNLVAPQTADSDSALLNP